MDTSDIRNLTTKRIERASYAPVSKATDARCTVWDRAVPGLGVRIYPSGKKAFVLSYRFKCRKHLIQLGDCRVLSLDKARDIAQRFLVQVIDGTDPLAERDRIANSLTVSEFCKQHFIVRYASKLKSAYKIERRIARHIEPAIGAHKLSAVTFEDVNLIHSRITKKGHLIEANRTVELISVIFNRAKDWNFFSGENPTRGVTYHKEREKDRYVMKHELPKLAEAIDQEKNPYAQKMIWMLLLTAARKNELRLSKWSDVDWDAKRLIFHDTKNGSTHFQPLSEAALTILKELPRIDGNPYIFPSTDKKKGIALGEGGLDRSWQRIRKRAELPDLTIHSLRHTVATWLSRSNRSDLLVGRILNHKDYKSTKRYIHTEQDQLNAALDAHAIQLLAAAGKGPTTSATGISEEPIKDVAA